jgi:hypothetical protein
MDEKLLNQIKTFNEAYHLIERGMKLIKKEFEKNPAKAEWAAIILADKRLSEMYRVVIKCMESEVTEKEFKKIVSVLKEKSDKKK